VDLLDEGREPGLLEADEPGRDPSCEPGVPGFVGEPSSSGSLSTCVDINQ